MTLFVTADTHFADPRVLKIDRRPFASLAEHDAALVERWNQAVGPQDTVWHLGDVRLGDEAEAVEALLARLNGQKHLVLGNNDGAATRQASGWASVQHYAELVLDGALLVLGHYPFRTWNRMGQRSVNLHGHSHGMLTPVTRQFDVGVDVWEFRPVPVAEVLAGRRRRAPRAEQRAMASAKAAAQPSR